MLNRKMLQIEQFEKGQVWMITGGARRAAKVLDVSPTVITRPGEGGSPPIKEARTAVTVQICTPARTIDGFVTSDEATVSMAYRKACMANFGYDMWQETWIDVPREKHDDNPRIKMDGQWEYMVRVHAVTGRHGAHEGKYKSGRITGQEVFGVLLAEDMVPAGLFDVLADDAETQAQLDLQLQHDQWKAAYEADQVASKREARLGNCADNKQWGPVSKLKMHAQICRLQVEDLGDGSFNEHLRTAIATYLRSLEINPWDVYEMKRDDFQEAVDDARRKMPQ